MKQQLSAILILSLFVQPLLAQTAPPPPTAKPKAEEPAEIIPIEDLLPADTLAYVATSNLAGLQHSFQSLDTYKVAKARLPKEELESGDNPLDTVSRFLSFGIKDERLLEGARIGFALLVPEMPEETEEQKKARAQGPRQRSRMPEPLILLFLEGTRIEDARQAREQLIAYFNDNFQPIGKLSDIKQTDYKGVKVDRFKDGQVGTWFGATYVMSQPAGIDRLLQLRADRRVERLADDQEFIRSRTQMMPQIGLFAYLNGKPLRGLLNSVFGGALNGGMSGSSLGFLSSFLTGAEGINSVALGSTFEREGVMDRLQINFDPAKRNILTTFFSGPKSEFKSAQFIPAGTEILVSHSLDWVKFYDDFFLNMFHGAMAQAELMSSYYAEEETKRKEAEANRQKMPEPNYEEMQKRIAADLTPEKLAQKIKEREAQMNQDLGFVLRDELAKDFGHEVTVAYGIPKLPHLVATAAVDAEGKKKDDEGWAVFIGIKDRAATQQAIVKAFAYFTGGMMIRGNPDDEQNAAPKTEEQRQQEREMRNKNAQSAWAMMPTEIYKNVEIKSIFAAYLGFSDEFLMVADSKETIKQMLDLSEGGRAMASDYNYSRAMNGVGGATTKVFVGPKMFDGVLNDFIKSWIKNSTAMEEDPSARTPLNVPATVAAAIDADASGIKLEAFSPLGVAGTIALWGFGSDVKRDTERKENDARYKLRELAKAEKRYAKNHLNRYAPPATLAKIKTISYDDQDLNEEDSNYKFHFKLKPGAKGYEATATPIKYGRQGRLSFFIDESGKIRSADKQGAVATVADQQEAVEAEVVDASIEPATAPTEAHKVYDVAPPPKPVRRKR
jgi:hypothetical protein